MAAVGTFVILFGLYDLTNRVSKIVGDRIAFMAFAPAVTLFSATSTDAFFGAPRASAAPLVPTQISISSIGVRASVEQVGKQADGSMGTPKKFEDVAWFSLGSKPGSAGNAVFAGHVNNSLTRAGVFEHLASIKLGDSIWVSDSVGHTLEYKVSAIEQHSADKAPAETIFATTGPSQIVLITCDGEWVPEDKTFSKRLVVFARLQ